jgi:hypothetical protein
MINTLGIGLIPLMSAFQLSVSQRFKVLGPSFGAIWRSMRPD